MPGWIYEEKYDGIRMLGYKEGKSVRLISRNAVDRTSGFPRIVDAMRALKPATLLLDGEIVVFDRKKISRFQLLQQGKGEAVYAVFDCLYHDGADLRRKALSVRREAMEKSLRSWWCCDSFAAALDEWIEGISGGQAAGIRRISRERSRGSLCGGAIEKLVEGKSSPGRRVRDWWVYRAGRCAEAFWGASFGRISTRETALRRKSGHRIR